mgnify:FL=1
MKIRDLLSEACIELNGNAADKTDVLNQMVDLMAKGGAIKDVQKYRAGVFAREEEGNTGTGEGIAIPHCKSDAVVRPALAVMVLRNGVDFQAVDDQSVKLIFLIAAPNTKDNVHLEVLSSLSVLLLDEDFSKNLINATTKEELLSIIDKAESKAKEEKANAGDSLSGNGKMILAVTSCPTGIAHTFMAAETIEKTAKGRGYRVKVETRGAGGAKNILTPEEIAEADCIIVAADAPVPMDRFDGKKLIECQVSDGINKCDALMDMVAGGSVAVYHSSNKNSGSKDNSFGQDSVGHKIYKDLMSGVSHMIPFVVGGGILIALAFLIDGLNVDLNSLPLADRKNFGSITPIAALLKGIGGTAFGFMLPILAGFIANAIADRPGLAVGFVGGALAANGTSGFLGALVAGFLAGYTVLFLKWLFKKLPESMEGIKPVLLYPLLGILIVGVVMTFCIEPPIGALNTALNSGLKSLNGTSAVILGMILGGMMAVDMGGPVNKAAYVFGTASIAAGNYNIMAAVIDRKSTRLNSSH